jgi:methenyltetrahydromethanopterin cyclohydrolase
LPSLSINQLALRLVNKLCDKRNEYRIQFKENAIGTKIIDAGIKTKGGLLAGKIITEICLGGLGQANISSISFGNLKIPAIFVYSDHPEISLLGSQKAGWSIKKGKYSTLGSGPARALALKPKSIYKKINYKDSSEEAVLVLETSKEPPEEVVKYISESCRITPDNLSIILVPTSSLAGYTQISGRAAEQGIHKLSELGLDPNCIINACGHAPILPIHPDFIESMGRTNDAILYGGVTYYNVDFEDDTLLKEIVEKSVSSNSTQYGRPFAEIFKEANKDFYNIDPNIFTPAVLTVNNIRTGKTFTAGKINEKVLKRSLGSLIIH